MHCKSVKPLHLSIEALDTEPSDMFVPRLTMMLQPVQCTLAQTVASKTYRNFAFINEKPFHDSDSIHPIGTLPFILAPAFAENWGSWRGQPKMEFQVNQLHRMVPEKNEVANPLPGPAGATPVGRGNRIFQEHGG